MKPYEPSELRQPNTTMGQVQARAFTIVELLVVVAIMMILVALLLPSLTKARDIARAAQCRSNLHQIGIAFNSFWVDHQMASPGVWHGALAGPKPWQRAWLGNEVNLGYPHEGVLLSYIGGADVAKSLYRCPGLETGVLGSGVGSNGMFDYSMIQAFNGAKLFHIPGRATLYHPVTGQPVDLPTPLVVEEHPAFHLNSLYRDPGHMSINRLGSWHPRGGGQYVSIDGSVHAVYSENELGPMPYEWEAVAPSGATVTLSADIVGMTYGSWNKN